ncbi:phage minor capsid protein [Nocardiopsis sp. HUAS JQ3]|uniref:phage minor capsid protein n=1 Tax=Nocardiopsis sp. HUAS JQ3 TaxID=3061629 RepID=UPI0023A9E77F|nr:phage minor capsid protein [Nocardiopsis sp. HUAS JQ3]WDZ91154.1 hypothetical protein PV789_00830 [Nocardiopsis sp. HUAS JQ3]
MPGVSPDQIDAIALHLGDIYREAELAITRDIADHLRRHPGAPTAYADGRLGAVRALRRSVSAVVSGLEGDGSVELRAAVADGYRLGTRSALADLPRQWLNRPDVADAAQAAADEVPQVAAVESLAASLVADVGAVTGNILRQALDAYREAAVGAVARVLVAGQTRRQASAAMWANLVNRGILGFTDRGGRRWRLSTYVEMAVRTSVARAAVQGQTDRLTSLGVPLVYVSDHGQECPRCRPFEGRVLRIGDGPTGTITVPHALTDAPVEVDVVATLAQARALGLHHPNCRHSVSGFLPGVTRVPKPENNPAEYDARMEQRRLERKIREGREAEASALTDEERKQAGARVRQRQAQLREHLDQHRYLKRLRYRERIGAGSTPRGGDTADAVTSIGPAVETTLDGEQTPFPVRLARPAEPVDAQAAADVDAGQLTLDDAPAAEETPAGLPDPPTMTDAQLETELGGLMAAGDYDSPRLADLMAEMDRRDRLGADPAAEEPPAPPERTLADMTEAELTTMLGDAYAEEEYDRAAQIEAELDHRDQMVEAAPDEPPPPTVRAEDLAWFDDDRLGQMAQEAHAQGRTADAEIIEAELDHRAQVAEEPPPAEWVDPDETDADRERREREEAQYAEMARLVEEEGYDWELAAAEVQGRDVEALRREDYVLQHRVGDDRRSFTELAREQYKLAVAQWYMAAEEATNGYLLTPAGQAAGIDPESLFSGPRSRAEKWASEELKRWWDANGRTTFEDYVESIEQGRDTRDPGRDFNR